MIASDSSFEAPLGAASPMKREAIERELGEQPLAGLLQEHGLTGHDLVEASSRPITHKLIHRASKGRRLTHHSKLLVLDAYNRATGESACLADLFTY